MRELSAAAQPTVLAIEDVHWADHGTLDLMRYGGRRIAKLRTLIVLTVRDGPLDAQHPTSTLLGELPSAAEHGGGGQIAGRGRADAVRLGQG